MATDVFYKSDAVKRGLGVLLGACFAGLLTILTWNIAKTAENESDIKLMNYRFQAMDGSIQEIKSDIKKLLERK